MVDPTFNVDFESVDGQLLGISELMDLRNRPEAWKPAQMFPPLPGRGITDYSLPFKDLLSIADAPSVDGLRAGTEDVGREYRSAEQTVRERAQAKYPSKCLNGANALILDFGLVPQSPWILIPTHRTMTICCRGNLGFSLAKDRSFMRGRWLSCE